MEFKLQGSALKPDDIASFLMDRDKGGDWRPCLRALATTDFAKIMDDSLSWGVIFTQDVQRAANVTMEEGLSGPKYHPYAYILYS